MADLMITEAMKQTVITRLATINSAISILNLTNGKPAKVTVEEVLDLAERIELWAWRDLLGEERKDAQAPDRPATLAPPTPKEALAKAVLSSIEGPALSKAEGAEPEPATGKKDDRPRPNGQGQRPGEASEKQINAIFGIGKSKGYSSQEIKTLVKERFGKDVDQLTGREASGLIGDLRAM